MALRRNRYPKTLARIAPMRPPMLLTVVQAREDATSKPRGTRSVGMKTVMVTCAPKVMAETT
jgi:hypothetical protein